MADTTATASSIRPGLADAVIPVDPDVCTVTVPPGVYSVATQEDINHLEVSYDGTTWATPSSVGGSVLWSSRMGRGGTFYLRKSSGSASTHPLLSRDHT